MRSSGFRRRCGGAISRPRLGYGPLIAVSLLSACAGWELVELPADTTLAPRQQVQVQSIDSLRLGNLEPSAMVGAAVPFLVLLVLTLALRNGLD